MYTKLTANVWKHFLLTVFVLGSLLTSEQARASVAEYYGEYVSLDERGNSLELQTKVTPLPWTIQPYLGFTYLRYAPLGFTPLIRRSPSIGVRWQALSWLRLYAEYRVDYEKPESALAKDDPRVGAFLGYWKQLVPLPNRFSLASDNYGEFSHMKRYSDSPMLYAWSKLVLRYNPTWMSYADAYLEFVAQESADPALGRRKRDLQAGLRAGYILEAVTINAQVFERFATFISAPQQRLNFLLGIGGKF